MTQAHDLVWDIPEPLSTFDVPLEDGTVTVVRRHGNPAGVRLVMSHGAGLANRPLRSVLVRVPR